MTIHSFVPELMVSDVDRSIAFYRDVLGFTVEAVAPESGKPMWAELAVANFRIMLQARSEMLLEMPFLSGRGNQSTTLFVLRCSSSTVRQFAEQNRKAVEACVPLRNTDYGTTEAGILDPDGHVVLLAGRDE